MTYVLIALLACALAIVALVDIGTGGAAAVGLLATPLVAWLARPKLGSRC